MDHVSDFSEPGDSGLSRLGSPGYGKFLCAFSDVALPVGGEIKCVDSVLEKTVFHLSPCKGPAWYVRAPRG